MKLHNKVVIVTGGSGLLGKAILLEIVKVGGIAINADINVIDDINNSTVYCNIADSDSIERCIDWVCKNYKKIDGLVNNAYPRSADWGTNVEKNQPISIKSNVEMHLVGYMIFCQKILAVMKEQKSGSIVNMGSIYGMVGNDFNIYRETNLNPEFSYSAIKGGIINFSKFLASYYGQYNIRINSLSPGGIFDNQNPTFVKNYEEKVPLKRMGNPQDIAPCVSFLLSEDSRYITGHNLVVDGGWTCI